MVEAVLKMVSQQELPARSGDFKQGEQEAHNQVLCSQIGKPGLSKKRNYPTFMWFPYPFPMESIKITRQPKRSVSSDRFKRLYNWEGPRGVCWRKRSELFEHICMGIVTRSAAGYASSTLGVPDAMLGWTKGEPPVRENSSPKCGPTFVSYQEGFTQLGGLRWRKLSPQCNTFSNQINKNTSYSNKKKSCYFILIGVVLSAEGGVIV